MWCEDRGDHHGAWTRHAPARSTRRPDRGLPAGVERRRASARSGRRATDDSIPRFAGLLDQIRPSTTLDALELLAGELSTALGAAGLDQRTDHQSLWPSPTPRAPTVVEAGQRRTGRRVSLAAAAVTGRRGPQHCWGNRHRLRSGPPHFLRCGLHVERDGFRGVVRVPNDDPRRREESRTQSPMAEAGVYTERAALRPKPSSRRPKPEPAPVTSTCTPPSMGSPDWPTPRPCPMKKPSPQSVSCTVPGSGSPPTASSTSSGSSPTTVPATAPRTSPTCCTAPGISSSPPTPAPNGKVERYHRILAEEFLYARTWTSETQRAEALKIWNIHFNYHRPHSAAAGQPPASRLTTGVTNLRASYS